MLILSIISLRCNKRATISVNSTTSICSNCVHYPPITFDTIRSDKLLDTLQTFLGDLELRMIRLLLADILFEQRF